MSSLVSTQHPSSKAPTSSIVCHSSNASQHELRLLMDPPVRTTIGHSCMDSEVLMDPPASSTVSMSILPRPSSFRCADQMRVTISLALLATPMLCSNRVCVALGKTNLASNNTVVSHA